MRKSILFFTLLFISIKGMAQCVPDASIADPGIYPDSATGLPIGQVGVPYSTDIQFRVPTDTVYLGLPATIVSIDISGVTGLPPGFTYTCTPSNCSFPGGSNGCIYLTGPAMSTPGVYPIVVDLIVNGLVFGSPQSITASNDNYSIVIDNSTAIVVPKGHSFGMGQNMPNPSKTSTEIPVAMTKSGNVTLSISNMLGAVILHKDFFLSRGNNSIQINTADFKSGIYLYSITSGNNTVTKRMIVSND